MNAVSGFLQGGGASGGERYVYVVLSQTGTALSRICKRITKARYNHASISLDGTLSTMYSFGRRHPRNPFWGGFVRESPHYGTFKRFSKTEALVMRVSVTEDQYRALGGLLERMYRDRRKYRYNYVGLVLAAFGKNRLRDNCYYCSEFVGDVLQRFGIMPATGRQAGIRPIELMRLERKQILFRGLLRAFA